MDAMILGLAGYSEKNYGNEYIDINIRGGVRLC